MPDVTPLIYYIQRILRVKPQSIREAATQTIELCPQEEQNCKPAICLQENLEFITQYHPEATPASEKIRISGGKKIHVPTLSFQIDSAKFLKGYFYFGMCKYPITYERPQKIVWDGLQRIDNGYLVSTRVGTNYFGHWLTDDLPLALLGEQFGNTYSYRDNKNYVHADAYQNIFDIHPKTMNYAFFEKITIFQDFSQNSLKRERYLKLRERAKAFVKKKPSRNLFVLRGNLGNKRTLINETQIQQYLESRGFITVDPEKLSSAELLEISMDAKIIIGCEGSQMAHFLYSIAQDGCMICLTPSYRFTALLKDFADCIGYYYGIVVGKKQGDGFSIEISDLEKVINLYERKHPS